MKGIFFLAVALLLAAGTASGDPSCMTQRWTAGWDDFSEPLSYKESKVSWSVNPAKSTLSVTFKLVRAKPSKLYQVGVHIFCTTFPATFGQFPVTGSGTCQPNTRQGVTEDLVSVELGVVTTDINGTGYFTVIVGPIAPGTYDLEFDARNGAGCNLTGGGDDCVVDFQSPGPKFGDATTITIP
jgi:hypothetical protein